MSGQTLSGHGVFTVWPQYSLELSTNFREVLQCLEKAPSRAFSLLKVLTSAFRIKNPFLGTMLNWRLNIVSKREIGTCIPISRLLTMSLLNFAKFH